MKSRKLIRLLSAAMALSVLAVPPLFAWESRGHVMIVAPPTSTEGTVHTTANGVTLPRLRNSVAPEYSDEARKAAFEGTCIVGLVVDTDGDPQNVHIVRRLGMGLDEKAIEAVKLYRFVPAMYKGHPVPVQINIAVKFRVGERSSGASASKPESQAQAFSTGDQIFRKPWPDGFITPNLIYDPVPETSKEMLKHKASGTVVVGMTVGKDGVPSQIHIVSSDSKYLVGSALAAVRQYRFEPGQYKGVPVVTELEVGITFNTF